MFPGALAAASVALAAACWAPFHAWPGCFQLQDFFLLISESNVRHEMGFKCSPAPWQQLLLLWQQPVGRLARLFPALSLFSSHFRKQRQARNGLQMFPAPWQQLLLLWQQPVGRVARLFPASSFFSFHAWPGCFQLQSFFLLISESNVRHEIGFKCSPVPWQQLLLPWQQPVGRLFTPGQAVSSFKAFLPGQA